MWIVFTAIWLYQITVVSGRFEDLRAAFNKLSDDPRVQAAFDGTGCHLARQRVGGVGPDLAAEHVAGKLIEQADQRDTGQGQP